MNGPLNAHRHITLMVEKPLKKSQIKSWFDCVRDFGPSGVISTMQTVDENGSPRSVKLIHRTVDDKEAYIIPISRDLLPAEVEKIVENFVIENKDLDFDIETNAKFTISMSRPDLGLDHKKHILLSKGLAKLKHDAWFKDKTDNGWRYGELSIKAKTHPLLLPWEQLPDHYKKTDLNEPEKIIALLNDQGYAVMPQDSLENILMLLKKVI